MATATRHPPTEFSTSQSEKVDTTRLAAHLRSAISGEVRFDDGSRALYATDASNYRQVPIGVVLPRTVDDIVATMDICRRYGAPVLSRGGGTSLAGQCCNVAVVMDMSKYYNAIVEVDPASRRARVQPGLVLDTLRDAAEQFDLTFAPDPSTHNHCTLGGMIGNNSCGVHSVMGGRTSDNVEELEVLTYDGLRLHVGRTNEERLTGIIASGGRRGEIYAALRDLRDRYGDLVRARFPDIPRRVSGYALEQLLPQNNFNVARALVGSEGTCVSILEATVRLVPSPRARSLLVLGYGDVNEAADHVPEILAAGPIGLEGIDDRLVDDMKKKGLHPKDIELLPPGRGWLLAEFGGESREESDARARELMDRLGQNGRGPETKLFDREWEERLIWKVRESGLGATARVPGEPDTWEGWEDAAVPPDRLGDYLRSFRQLLDRYGYACSLYGHFGQGCVHTRIDFDLKSSPGVAKFRSFLDDAADLVVSFGGSLSGEHGDGQSRAALLSRMYGSELVEAFREFKRAWDPAGKMNPGKVVDPYEPDENLRYGSAYRAPAPATHFHLPDDEGRFGYALERCVGVGECRRLGGGTMCPSYMVTREEKHSTRGRARLLWEMLQGEVTKGGWRDDDVRDALDLCLACKGCKGDCPMNVDMATYKAEFYSHYYAGRVRPVQAYSLGLIRYWARAASFDPGLVNLAARTPGLSAAVKWVAGIDQRRSLPPFAESTFRSWFRGTPRTASPDGPRVILWPDTFTEHFLPGSARSAVRVLEAAGVAVDIPRQPLCCGRPLYDWGMLDLAKRTWRQALDALGPEIDAGTPVIGLEPSCVSAFRDELPDLLADDPRARRLADQTFLLSEYLVDQLPGYRPPTLARKALVHGHCHHKSSLKFDAEQRLLEQMGLDLEILDSGCCGMAGAFGFERGDHYDVSQALGERVLLPAVRAAPAGTLVIADGFSCQEQIRQATGQSAIHLADLLALGLDGHVEASSPAPARPAGRTLVAAGAVGIAALAWSRRRSGRRRRR